MQSVRTSGGLRRELSESFRRFFHTEASSGIVLAGAALVALVIANSPLGESYHHLWETSLGVRAGGRALELSLHHWVSDGLMALFFLLVGMEIKREILYGELASLRRAALPAVAALGGMLVPAAIYLAFAAGDPAARRGWGIPMATDIAFAVGVLAVLGRRAPAWLKVFVTALAIVDDLGAVIVIAVFYTADLAVGALGVAGGATVLLVLLNRARVDRLWPYLIVGAVLWLAFLQSGVHATIAGVLLGMTIPTRARCAPGEFVTSVEEALGSYRANLEAAGPDEEARDAAKEAREAALAGVSRATSRVESPLHRLEVALQPWVAYLILPIFALANAGVPIPWSSAAAAVTHPITAGVAVGLVAGKPLGIFGASWLAVKLGLADLPSDGTWGQLLGGAALGGIGFTMSMFIANLAFADPVAVDFARLGIVGGSAIAAIVGTAVLVLAKRPTSGT